MTQLHRCRIFSSKGTRKRLAAGLRPEPLGELKRSPRPPSREKGGRGRGRARGWGKGKGWGKGLWKGEWVGNGVGERGEGLGKGERGRGRGRERIRGKERM